MKEKKIPNFLTEDEEREFWDKQDSTKYEMSDVDEKIVMQPSAKTIQTTVRFSKKMIEELRFFAGEKDIPYQTLIKIWLKERISEERERIEIKRKIAV